MVVSPAPALTNSKHAARESKEALAELKTKLEFALSRLNDQDTQRTGIEEIREFLQTLYPDWFPMVIACIGEAGTNLKPLGRCESVKLLGLLAELHGDAVIPLLQRMLQVVLTRLQDADLHLREACAETVFRLTRSLVVDADGSPVFATLLKPLFAALTEHNKWVQIGAASCICAVIQGSPPAVLSENLQRLSSRLVQHLSLPLAMARPQLLSACIHVMQAVSLSEFDDVLPSLMPCLEICLNSTADWQTRKQAVEVLQALGDQVELGQSLQIPLVDPSVHPTPFQKKLSTMMDSLREDKVRAVREAAKDVLVRWCITKAAPSSVSVGSGGERADKPLRSSSPCAAQFAPEREAQGGQPGLSGLRVSVSVPGRSTSPGPASWDRDQARLNESTTGGGRARNVRPPPRERDSGHMEEERSFDRMEERRCSDAAAEKAARNIAVKNALSNADLSSTKKPRPKRERVSIFSGPANSSFFQSANQHTSTTGPDDVEDVVIMPSPQEDRLLSSGGSAEIERSGGIHNLEQTEESSRKVSERSEEEEGMEGKMSLEDVCPAKVPEAGKAEHLGGVEVDIGGFGEEDMAPLASRFPRRLNQGEGKAKRQPRDVRKPLRQAQKKIEVEAAFDNADSPTEGKPDAEDSPGARIDEPPSPLQMAMGVGRTSSRASEELHDEKCSAMAAETGSASPAPASWMWDEPHRPEPFASPSVSPQRLAAADEELEALLAQVQSLTQQVLSLEEDKHRSERRMTERFQQLARTCEGQGELIAAQQRRLEAQEQQMQMLEERVAQQDDELAQMDQQLQEQQLQLQQQDQRLEQDDQQLNEHQQQLEQQEQELEKHTVLFREILNHSASSASSVRQKAWAEEDAQEKAEDPTGAPSRWAQSEAWAEGAEVPRAPNPSPANAAIIGAGGALAGSSSERPLALPGRAKVDTAAAKPSATPKPGGQLWDSIVELCAERRFLEAYKQVIAEPEETCLLRLMKHTGPIVDRLDAESNSRLIRRLIHILSSPSKESAAASIEQIFSWLWQALNQGIHFTASQVEDLVSALQKVSSAQSPLSGAEKAEATQLLQKVSTHRRS